MKSAPILLALSAALAPTLAAADEDALVTDDIKFAENLARYQYFGLALDVVQDVQSTTSLSNDLEGDAVLTEARIYKRYSQATANEDEIASNQDKAIELLYDWRQAGSSFAFHPRRPDALQDLAELLRERGVRFKETAESRGDPEAALDQARSDFKDADEVYETLRREAEDRAEQLTDEGQTDRAADFLTIALNTELYRAINFIEWADIASDAEFKLENAIEAGDTFLWELPEQGMLISYVGLQHTARALQKLGALTNDEEPIVEAIEIYDQCVEELTEYFWEAEGVDNNGKSFKLWEGLGPGQRAQVAGVTSDTFGMKASLFVDLGRIDDSVATIGELTALHDKHQQPLGREGHQALLAWVEALDQAGHAAKGLDVVKRVAQEGAGTAEGERAARMLSNLDPGVLASAASPDVLMTLASTYRKDKRYDDAAFTYLKVANTDLASADADKYLIESWLGAASALRSSGRYLEAGLAYEQALEQLDGTDNNDELRIRQLESASGGLYRSYDLNYKQTAHAFDKKLRDDAREKLINMGLADADLQFNAAKEAFDEAELMSRTITDASSADDKQEVADAYATAITELESVDPAAPSFERALVSIGRAHRGKGDSATAIEFFDRMLARIDDSSLTPTDPKGRSRREQATAEARYYKAKTQFDDLGDARAALATLKELEQDVPNQSSFHELAKYQRVLLHASLGEAEEAQAALNDLEENFSESNSIGGAAFYLAAALYDQSEAATDPAVARDLKSRAADEMWKYAESLNFSSFSNALNAADWYVDVGRYDDARAAYEKILAVFDGRESVDRLDDARIGLATVMNGQRSFGEARQLWKDLVARHARSPRVLSGAARSYGGWLEMDDAGNIVEISGSGDYEDAFTIWSELKRGYDRSAKYEQPWWEAKLLAIYTQYRLGSSDPKGLKNARAVLDNQRISTAEYDRDTMSNLEEDKRYEDLLRPYFKYLERKIPSN